MPRGIRSTKDRDGTHVQVECGFQAEDGTCFLLLRRLPPHYARSPVWLVRLSTDTLSQRTEEDGAVTLYKAYSIQDLTETEKKFLCQCQPGSTVLPFFSFTYPNVIRVLGKRFRKLDESEITPLLSREYVFMP